MKQILSLLTIFALLQNQAFARSGQSRVPFEEYQFSEDIENLDLQLEQNLTRFEKMSSHEKEDFLERRIDRLAKKLSEVVELPKVSTPSVFDATPVEGLDLETASYLGAGITDSETGDTLRAICLEYEDSRCIRLQDVLSQSDGTVEFGAQSVIEYVQVTKEELVKALKKRVRNAAKDPIEKTVATDNFVESLFHGDLFELVKWSFIVGGSSFLVLYFVGYGVGFALESTAVFLLIATAGIQIALGITLVLVVALILLYTMEGVRAGYKSIKNVIKMARAKRKLNKAAGAYLGTNRLSKRKRPYKVSHDIFTKMLTTFQGEVL